MDNHRCPSTPLGPKPALKFLNTYDQESQLGHFINAVSSDRFGTRTLIRHGQMASRPCLSMPLFGKIDASQPGFRGAHPDIQYSDSIRMPEDAAITNIYDLGWK